MEGKRQGKNADRYPARGMTLHSGSRQVFREEQGQERAPTKNCELRRSSIAGSSEWG